MLLLVCEEWCKYVYDLIWLLAVPFKNRLNAGVAQRAAASVPSWIPNALGWRGMNENDDQFSVGPESLRRACILGLLTMHIEVKPSVSIACNLQTIALKQNGFKA